VDIASTLPLWVAQDFPEADPSPIQYAPLIGGWKYATGRQWKTETKDTCVIHAPPCNGSVDLDSFLPSSVNSVDIGLPDPPIQGYSCQTTADGLRYRTCANTTSSCPVVGRYPVGTLVEFKCQALGESITGDWITP
jgi:hypothetical protein